MTTRILLLEDDFLQRSDVKGTLEREFDAEVLALSCEKEFRDRFESVAEQPPSVAVLDIMLRWANASREESAQPEDATDPAKAGIRCARMLRSDGRTKDVRVILYSVLGKNSLAELLPEGIPSLEKEHDYENLIEAVKDALIERTNPAPHKEVLH